MNIGTALYALIKLSVKKENFNKLAPDVWKGLEKVSNDFTFMPNNISSMKYAVKSEPGLADVGVPHGDGDGSRT